MNTRTRPLETGWLPDTPIEDSLLRRFLANQSDLQDHVAAAAGGRSSRSSDVAMSDSGTPAAYLNQAALLRPVNDLADPVLDELDAFYRSSAAMLISAWPTPDLGRRGWHLVGHPMFVVRGPVDTPRPVLAEQVAVRLADTPKDLALVERVVAAGYPAPELTGLPPNAALGAALLEGPIKYRIGYLDSTPVAAAASNVGHGVVNLCLAATLPAARRRGVWHALVNARCADAPTLPAVAFTSDDSRSGFVRMGFLPIARFTLWGRIGNSL